MQKQIVIDNMHYCTQQKVLAHVDISQKDIEKSQKNKKIKFRARKVIKKMGNNTMP